MKTLLIVEDDKLMLRGLEIRFQKSGFDIKTAVSVPEAREKLQEYEIDCIVSDISMDNYDDGIVFFNERLMNGDTTPTIFHSSGEEFEQQALSMGAIRFFSKTKTNEMISFVKKVSLWKK